MKRVLKCLYLTLVFIVIDAFVRSIIPNLRRLSSSEDYDFWGFLAFQMVYFIAFDSWFYIPIVGAFYGLSNFIKFDRLLFIAVGALLAYAHYIFYCLTTGDSFGSEKFYIRTVQYILFGGVFGAFRYHLMLDKRSNQSDS
jgi:hypothetical protein